MANKILWEQAWQSRGNVLTTELNSLADGAFSAVGSVIDNDTNLDQFASFLINLASLNPTAGAYLQIFLVQSNDGGSTYEDPPSSTNPGLHMTATPPLNVATGSGTKRIVSPAIRIPPGKFKAVLFQKCNVALAASANTVAMYSANDEIQ